MFGRGVMLLGVAAEAGGGFLPWVRTGRRDRTSFELIDSARTLDVLDSAVHRWLAIAWYLVPLAAALCWLAVLLGHRRAALVLALGAGLLGAAFALSIQRAALPSLPGVWATLAAAIAVILGGAVDMIERRKA